MNLLQLLSPLKILKSLLWLCGVILSFFTLGYFKGKSNADTTNVEKANEALNDVLDAERKVRAMSDDDLNSGLQK